MARYIDKDKVLNRLRYLCEVASEPPQDNDDVIEWALLQRLEKEFSKMPTADVEEVKHGKWKYECLECSVCGRNISEIYDADSYMSYGIEDELRYCPFCGAKMNGGKEE